MQALGEYIILVADLEMHHQLAQSLQNSLHRLQDKTISVSVAWSVRLAAAVAESPRAPCRTLKGLQAMHSDGRTSPSD